MSPYVDVEGLMARVPLERALAFYGVEWPQMQRVGDEVRTRCFIACGRSGATGDRAMAIQADHPAKLWRCHESGCEKGGNLVSLCDYLKPGENGGGRPRGDRFKAILRDLQAMAVGEERPSVAEASASEPPTRTTTPAKRNVPLAQSDNERARGLVDLDVKFVVDPAAMSPKAASYFRHRPFLTPDACRRWRMGYLPRDSGGDRSGGTMRGLIVYPMLADDGDVLTWFGRDPEYEGKTHAWIVAGKQGKEPEKYHLVRGFERGLELFGQHRLREDVLRQQARDIGLAVVPGPNDVIALDSLGVPAVGLCGLTVTPAQAGKLGTFARESGAFLIVLFDADESGTLAARAALVELAQVAPVRLAWSESMHGGAFRGRAPSSLTAAEWECLRATLLGEVVA